MNLLLFVKKVNRLLVRKADKYFSLPACYHLEYVKKLGNPLDDIDRSFKQYKCQEAISGIFMTFFLNLFSLIAILVFYFKRNDLIDEDFCDAVFISEGVDSVLLIPDSVYKEFANIKEQVQLGEYFGLNEKAFFWKIVKRHPLSFYYQLKCLLKLRMYGYTIKKYAPKAIIVTTEFSFTSSVLTAFCSEQGITHIDVMHGEKLLNMRDSFFRFDRTYVWDEHYKDIFVDLMADETQFIIEHPRSFAIEDKNEIDQTVDFSYYLQIESLSELENIKRSLMMLVQAGYIVAVRPHPIYSDSKNVSDLFSDFIIESKDDITIEESIMRTKNVISRYSTVLYQAYLFGKKVVVDDITKPQEYELVKEYRYIMLSKPCTLLSDLLSDLSDNGDD